MESVNIDGNGNSCTHLRPFSTFLRYLKPLSIIFSHIQPCQATSSHFQPCPVISRPGQSQGLLYKDLHHSFINWVILFLPQLYSAATPKRLEITLSGTIKLCHSYKRLSKSWKATKLHHWFKSYGHFIEGVDFAYWWSCIGKGLRLQPPQQACF